MRKYTGMKTSKHLWQGEPHKKRIPELVVNVKGEKRVYKGSADGVGEFFKKVNESFESKLT